MQNTDPANTANPDKPTIDKTSAQLLKEVEALRQRVADLEARYRQARDLYQKADEKYRDLFENAGDSIFIIDPATRRILNANANASRRLGYTPDELLNLSLDDVEVISDTSDKEATEEALSWESTFSGARFYECHYRRKDGTLIPVEVSSSPTVIDGSKVLQNFVRDISKRREIEDARRRAEQEREQVIKELDAFAHTVAHDLKSPLGIITGYASLLEDSFGDFSQAEIRDMITAIGRGGLKMDRIIDEIMLFASTRRLEDVETGPLDMPIIINEAISRLELLIQERSAEIILLDAASWPIASGYAPWIEEVWANYISNAIKYGGTLPRIELGASLAADNVNMVRFWVRDNGAGLAPELQAQLFKMYSRLGTTRIHGHGLGLSIVQRIVNKLAGQVGVESVVGQGSVFSFTLPLYTPTS